MIGRGLNISLFEQYDNDNCFEFLCRSTFLFRSILELSVQCRCKDEKLVMQTSHRQPQSSVTVRCFSKQKKLLARNCYLSGWCRCPNPNLNARFFKQKKQRFVHHLSRSYILRLYSVSFHSTHLEHERESNPVTIIGKHMR